MLSSDFYRNIFLLFYIIFMPLDAWAGSHSNLTKPIEIRLNKDIPVLGEKIVLGDVATIYAKSIHDFQSLSSLVLGQLPQDTKELKVPISYLRARIKEVLPAGAEFSINAPLEIAFHQEKFGITAEEIAQEIIKMGKEKGKFQQDIEIVSDPISGFNKLDAFKISNIKIEPAGEMPFWKGEMTFKVSSLDSNNSNQVWLKTKLRWFANTWVAGAEIHPFQSLDLRQFKKARVEVTNIREELVSAIDEDALRATLRSGRAKRTIRSESPLTVGMLDRKPDINMGQKLKVVFVSENGLQVSADGAIIGAASIGDDVKAKLHSSKKIVTGKLISESVMEVAL